MNDHRRMSQTIRSAAMAAAEIFVFTFFPGVIVARAQSPAPVAAAPIGKAELSSQEKSNVADFLSSITTDDGVKAAKAKTVAILQESKGEKVELSRAEKSMMKGDDDYKRDLKYCNENDFDNPHWVRDTSRFCSNLADHLESHLGVNNHAAEVARLRACAFFSHYGADTNCADLGEFYMKRGDYAHALGVVAFAPNCNQAEPMVSYREACMNLGYTLSVKLADKHLQKSFSTAQCYLFSDPYACERLNREFGASLDLAAVQERHNAMQEKDSRDLDAAFAADEEERLERQQAKNDKRDAIISALQGMPGASDPNAIVNTANQQAAAIRAIGDANAARQQQAAQARLAAQQSSNRPAPSSTSSSGAWNGLQNTQTPAGISPPASQTAATANSASSASTAANYAAPLSASCIYQFWDANNYNWLSFQNTCPQAVHVGFIAASPHDTFGMSAKDLAPGQADSTGWSQSDVNRKGGFVLFVCPAGYGAVDSATDQPVRYANQNFRCKQQ